jgi:hypothetical protein
VDAWIFPGILTWLKLNYNCSLLSHHVVFLGSLCYKFCTSCFFLELRWYLTICWNMFLST